MTTLVDPRAAARGLVARTRWLTRPDEGSDGAPARLPDLLAAAGADGVLWRDEHGGFAGRGVALRIELPGGVADPEAVRAVSELLRLVTVDDEVDGPGSGAVALGALAFRRDGPSSLVVPEVTVGRRGTASWITTVAPARGAGSTPSADAAVAAAADAVVAAAFEESAERDGAERDGAEGDGAESPDEFTLLPGMPHAAWRAIVRDAVGHIRAGDLAKVVLARRIDVVANRPFLTSEVLERLIALYPACTVFRVDGFLGASPELLIRRRGLDLVSHPLAGTVARSGDATADRALVDGLLASVKDRAEHAFVVDELRRMLRPICEQLDVAEQPSILELRNVSHLATRITGRLPRSEDPPSVLELVARVHPTPAVAGTPTDEATAYLESVEGFDRGRYAGPVGWIDARGDGAWVLGIRSAQVAGNTASMYAGVGIVADSEPREELAETQLKLQALLAALVRP